jgi:hypothetical protein
MDRSPTGSRRILLAGLVAGTLDLADAIVFFYFRGVKPVSILQSIASGLLGRAAYQGGYGTAVLGVLLHFTIALTAAAVYYAASRRLDILRRRPIAMGLLYGLAVYLFMNRIVLPLSAFPQAKGPASPVVLINGVLAVMLLVGLPIALLVNIHPRRVYLPEK